MTDSQKWQRFVAVCNLITFVSNVVTIYYLVRIIRLVSE